MKTHPFAALIYSIEDTLGLDQHCRKSQQISRSPYDAHREYFQHIVTIDSDDALARLHDVFHRLHVGSHLPPEMIDAHMDISEGIFNAIMRKAIPQKETMKKCERDYVRNALIPLLCTDIFIFKDKADPTSIYYHLDQLLMIDDLVKRDGNDASFQKAAAQKYMKNYIKSFFNGWENPIEKTKLNVGYSLIPELLDYLKDLTKPFNQTCKQLNKLAAQCKEGLRPGIDLEPIVAAYTAVIILQDIEKKIDLFGHFHRTYQRLVSGDEKLTSLESLVRYALNIKNESMHMPELLFHTPHGVEKPLHYNDCKVLLLDSISEKIVSFFKKPKIYKFDNEIKLPQLNARVNELSKMVLLPPAPYYLAADPLDSYYNLYKLNENSMKFTRFSKNNFSEIIALTKPDYYKCNQYQQYFSQYIPLIEALDFIKKGEPELALNVINSVPQDTLFPFGFIKHSLAVLKIGLMYLSGDKEGFTHHSLMSQVNDIINYQGLVFIPIIASIHVVMNSKDAWLSKNEYENNSILFGGNTYNAIISQAIYCYNFTIARHCSHDAKLTHEQQNETSEKNHSQFNYNSPLILHNLLDNLNDICGKILLGLDQVSTDVKPVIFAKKLYHARIITEEELTENLIYRVNGSSLGVCLLDHLTIITFFSVPGDNVENIVELGKNTRVVELLFRAYQYHQTLDEKHKKQ
ncbi:hypothetical protein [Aeromonas veronii]|uniref:hypothetical protein n=1 Tax=Aeromonas veronii TaxID=654 RepID=UPI003D1AEBD6